MRLTKTKIPKWYEVDSTWRTAELVKMQIKALKQADKELKVKTTIKVVKKKNWFTIYVYTNFGKRQPHTNDTIL